MARPKTISREQILDAARELFLEQGFKVSTATIAKAAGISEGTIFKRFSTKDILFSEAMCPRQLEPDLMPVPGVGEVPQALTQLAERLIALYRELIPRLLRLWAHSTPGEQTPMQRMQCAEGTSPPMRLIAMLTEYLDAEVVLGRLQTQDTGLLARTLMATAHNYVLLEMVVGPQVQDRTDAEHAADTIHLLWRGLEPRREDVP